MTTPREIAERLRDFLGRSSEEKLCREAASTIEQLVEALEKTEALIQQGQAIIGAHLPPDGMDVPEAMRQLIGLLDGPVQRDVQDEARRALTGGEEVHWRFWKWPRPPMDTLCAMALLVRGMDKERPGWDRIQIIRKNTPEGGVIMRVRDLQTDCRRAAVKEG